MDSDGDAAAWLGGLAWNPPIASAAFTLCPGGG
jgi:hypothetical protein